MHVLGSLSLSLLLLRNHVNDSELILSMMELAVSFISLPAQTRAYFLH